MNIKKVLKLNKNASFKFDTYKEFCAGLSLRGDEVRSIKRFDFNINDAILVIRNNELFLDKFVIKNLSSRRLIKLLLNRNEINKILSMLSDHKFHGFVKEVFITNNNLIKVLLGVGRIKRKFDRKYDQKRSSMKRELEKSLKEESKFY